MLNELSESQIKELNVELAKLPSCFGEVKEAILSGNGYWYPLSGKEPAMIAVPYSLEKISSRHITHCKYIMLLLQCLN